MVAVRSSAAIVFALCSPFAFEACSGKANPPASSRDAEALDAMPAVTDTGSEDAGANGDGAPDAAAGLDAAGGLDAPAADVATVPDGGRDFSTDRSAFFGNSRCSSAGVRLCEDFESGALDRNTWAVVGTMPA